RQSKPIMPRIVILSSQSVSSQDIGPVSAFHDIVSTKRRIITRGAGRIVGSMATRTDSGNAQGQTPPAVDQYLIKDPERFTLNLARAMEAAGKAAAAWTAPREKGEVRDVMAEPMADMVKTFSKLTEYWLSDPARALEAQTRLFAGYMNVWSNAIQRVAASDAEPETAVKPDKGDKRFQDSEWAENAFFDFLKQAYLVTSRWAGDLVANA